MCVVVWVYRCVHVRVRMYIYIYILCGEPLQEYDIGEHLCLLWCRGLSVGAAAGGRRVPAQ